MRPRWKLAALLAITIVVLGYTVQFPFMGDDYPQIVENARVQSWSAVPSYFTTHLWSQVPGAAARFYRPLFLLVLRLLYACFGLWTPGWHAALLLTHLATTAVVYWAVRQWKSAESALLAAALFALHPVHAEVVAWVSAISEPCLAAALVGSLLLARRMGWKPQAISLALFACALGMKETAIVWPAAIFALSAESMTQRLRRTAPFAIVAALYLALRVAVLGSINTPLVRATPLDPIYVPTALGHYFLHLVWPVGLSTYCEYLPSVWLLLFCVVILAGLVWVALRGEFERLAVLILLLPLLPTLNLGSIQLDALVQDRYLYLPSVGFVMLLMLLLERLPRPSDLPVLAVLLGAMAAGCVSETLTYSDAEHFYRSAVQAAPHNAEARTTLGRIYTDQGRYAQSIAVLEPWVAGGGIAPEPLYRALLTLAYCHERQGQMRQALAYYTQAEAVQPDPDLVRHIMELRSRQ